MLQLCKLSNTGSKPTCLVLRTIIKHDPTSHLVTARASDSVIYSDIARVISLRIIIINPYVSWHYLNLSHMSNATIVTKKQNIDVVE